MGSYFYEDGFIFYRHSSTSSAMSMCIMINLSDIYTIDIISCV